MYGQNFIYKYNGALIRDSRVDELLEHLDNSYVPVVTGTSANPRIYGITEEGTQTTYFATQTPDPHTLIQRDASGRSQIEDGVTPKQIVNKKQLDTKLDITGGTVTGNLAIQGDLTVAGTTKSEKTKTLMVEDNVIVTNANKVALQALLSGIAINKDANATYGIMYDPADDTVKFGQGTLDKGGKFTFAAGEGQPVAIRDDSSKFTNNNLVKWDSENHKLVDAGQSVDNLGGVGVDNKTITKTPNEEIQAVALTNGTDLLTYAEILQATTIERL